MYIKEDPQSQLGDLPFAQFVFDKNHVLVKLGQAIQWDNLLGYLGKFYSAKHGRPTTPLRAQAGTLIIKFIKNLSDREAVAYVTENIYAQRFCGLSPAQATGFMHPATGLAQFRAKIGVEGMAFIGEILTCVATHRSLKKQDRLIIDTTCVPLDILYPTDTRLLERCRQSILKLFKKAKELGLNIGYRTYARTARKIFLTFTKMSKPKQKTRKKVHKQMFQFVRRNLKQLMDLRELATCKLGKQCQSDIAVGSYLKELKTVVTRVRTILHQQKLLRSGMVSIPNRIVSFHKDHCRPIVRGKFPLSTEFGPKILVGIVKSCAYVIEAFQNNCADATMVSTALRWFKQRFGRLPKKLLGDRGFYSKWRVGLLEKMGIVAGLQQRGKNVQTSKLQQRMIRQRLPIEALISLSKRKFGWGKCRARIPQHEASWIGMGAACMNVHRTFLVRPP